MAGLRGFLMRIWTGGEPRSTLASPDTWLFDALGGEKTLAGVTVTRERAMGISAVSSAVRLIAESIGSLPIQVHRVSDSARTRVTEGAAYQLLADAPNSLMTTFSWIVTMAAHVLLEGNAYSVIIRDGAGEPTALLPVDSRDVQILKQRNGELAYTVRLDGQLFQVNQANMLHVPGLAFDGITGLSPIRFAAQSMGLSIAAEHFGASFFGNGSVPSGVITVKGKPDRTQQQQMLAAWTTAYGGAANAQKTAVLVDGAEFHKITVNPDEAQFIESRKFQVSEIARWFRVPPHMIADLERSTNNNIEQQGLEYVTYTLTPWLVRFEQEFDRKLFPANSVTGKPSGIKTKFNVRALLRGDAKSRGLYYVQGRQWGWLSVNDIRELEDMNPVEDGDTYLTPMNMKPLADAGNTDDASKGNEQ